MIVVYNTTLRYENVTKDIPHHFICVSVAVSSVQ